MILKISYKRVVESLLVKSNPNTQLFVGCLKHIMVWQSLIILFGISFWGRLYPIARHTFNNSSFPLRQRMSLSTGLFFSPIQLTHSTSGLSGKRLRPFVVASQVLAGSTGSLIVGQRSSLDGHLAWTQSAAKHLTVQLLDDISTYFFKLFGNTTSQ